MFFKVGVLKSFTKFKGKHLCQSLFFNKVTGEKVRKNFKNTFLTEHFWTNTSAHCLTDPWSPFYNWSRKINFLDWIQGLIISALHKEWSFSVRIFSVNVTKSTVSSGFDHIYWRDLSWKTSFFVQCYIISLIFFCGLMFRRFNMKGFFISSIDRSKYSSDGPSQSFSIFSLLITNKIDLLDQCKVPSGK